MLLTVVGTILATVLVLSGVSAVAFLFWDRTKKPEEDTSGPRTLYLEELSADLAALKVEVRKLPSLWEEERERARKHADRAGASYRSAEKLLSALEDGAEDGGEDPELFEDNDEGGEIRLLPPMREGMGITTSAGDANLRERAAATLQAMKSRGL